MFEFRTRWQITELGFHNITIKGWGETVMHNSIESMLKLTSHDDIHNYIKDFFSSYFKLCQDLMNIFRNSSLDLGFSSATASVSFDLGLSLSTQPSGLTALGIANVFLPLSWILEAR